MLLLVVGKRSNSRFPERSRTTRSAKTSTSFALPGTRSLIRNSFAVPRFSEINAAEPSGLPVLAANTPMSSRLSLVSASDSVTTTAELIWVREASPKRFSDVTRSIEPTSEALLVTTLFGSLEDVSSGGKRKNCTDFCSDHAIITTNTTKTTFRAISMSFGLKSNTGGG